MSGSKSVIRRWQTVSCKRTCDWLRIIQEQRSSNLRQPCGTTQWRGENGCGSLLSMQASERKAVTGLPWIFNTSLRSTSKHSRVYILNYNPLPVMDPWRMHLREQCSLSLEGAGPSSVSPPARVHGMERGKEHSLFSHPATGHVHRHSKVINNGGRRFLNEAFALHSDLTTIAPLSTQYSISLLAFSHAKCSQIICYLFCLAARCHFKLNLF